jgi:SAM-dependent methyltransferase
MTDFDELVTEALDAPFSGWDFSWLDRHSRTEPLPWDYAAEVAALARKAATMLDMGTGGGELLSRLPARAPRTVATEGWPPNVPVAARRLLPLGIPVVHVDGALDNDDQDSSGSGDGRLPFRDGSFDLVCNRHESFRAAEVSRVLAPGGTFVTQQVDYHLTDGLAQALGIEMPAEPDSWLELAKRQVTDAGLLIRESAWAPAHTRFEDIAGVVYYLRLFGEEYPGYSLDKYRQRLRALFEDVSVWPVTSTESRFLLRAVKPPTPCVIT